MIQVMSQVKSKCVFGVIYIASLHIELYILHADVFDRCFIHRVFTICPFPQKEVCQSPSVVTHRCRLLSERPDCKL